MIAKRSWLGNTGNPEKIPLSGPSRAEAEHPQPRFGQVGFTNPPWMSGPLSNGSIFIAFFS